MDTIDKTDVVFGTALGAVADIGASFYSDHLLSKAMMTADTGGAKGALKFNKEFESLARGRMNSNIAKYHLDMISI